MRATTLTLESIGQFRNWLSDRGRSALTVRAYTTDLKTFLKDCREDAIDLTEEYEEFGLTWLQMNRENLAPKTTLRRRTSLVAFALWAGLSNDVFGDWIGPTPAKGMPNPLVEGMAGVQRMINAAQNEKHKALVSLCGQVGCRVREAIMIEPRDLNAQRMSLTIRGKGDKTRVVPITPEAWEVLAVPTTRALLERRTIVGFGDERYARRRITELGVLAGLTRGVASHDLRATLATHMYNQTKNLRFVQEVLGHASIKTTQLYLGIDFEDIREGMRP